MQTNDKDNKSQQKCITIGGKLSIELQIPFNCMKNLLCSQIDYHLFTFK